MSYEPVTKDSYIFPMSFAQQRLWFLDKLEPGNPLYNAPWAVRMKGALNLDALQRTYRTIVSRHESLRTTFNTFEGKPVQIVQACRPVTIQLIDLTAWPEAEREAEGLRLVAQEAHRPFNLAQGPLLRIALLRLGEFDHVLLLVLHHIISDLWSLEVLIREMWALYEAYLANEPSPLPELPIQYGDYAVWQHQWLRGEALEAELSYWKKQLSDANPVLDLPTDRPRPTLQRFRGARQTFLFYGDLTERLKSLGARQEATLFMTTLAAFKALLFRYTRQPDLVVGTPIANRDRVEIEGLIGFFANMLALRTQVSASMTIRELLAQVRMVALGAYEHQHLPFEKLVEELRPERSTAHNPLFQVTYSLQSGSQKVSKIADLMPNSFEPENESAKLDLALAVGEKDGGLAGIVEYNTDLFDHSTITRMIEHYRGLLGSIAEGEDKRVGEIEILGEWERHQIEVEWNDTAADHPAYNSVKDMFEEEARRRPDAVAVEMRGEQVSYGELNRRANRLGRYLRSKGVGVESKVGICVDRSIEMVVAVMGVLKAGGAYVPMEPGYPQERLTYMREEAEAEVVVTQGKYEEKFEGRGVEVIKVDECREQIEAMSCREMGVEVDEANLAYVIYTSGSTGKPKGVMIEQRGLVNYLIWAGRAYQSEGGRGTLVHTPVGFDLTVTSLLLPLVKGERVEMVSEQGGIEELAERLTKGGGYWLLKMTPAHVEAVTRLIGEQKVERAAEVIVIGGEALSYEQIKRWRGVESESKGRVINEYGPSETVVGCIVNEVGEEEGEGGVAIGRPISNARVYVMSESKRVESIGVEGEIYIGGAGVGRGYQKQAEETAERYVPDRYSERAGARMYRTGDVGRYQSDGKVEYLGRADNQVKVRGYRIELGEIEAVIEQHERVKKSVVMAREEEGAGKRLVCYYTSEGEVRREELREHLGRKLPEYMVPGMFIEMEQMPLTANGKIDCSALPPPEQKSCAMPEDFVAASSSVERLIAAIWAEALGTTELSIHDNFFDLGGHSLLLIQIHSKLQKLFDKPLSLIDLFKHTTISSLANFLSPQHSTASVEPIRGPGGESQIIGNGSTIAIIGMAGRFPGARTLDEFWENLKNGVESVSFFSREELESANVAAALLDDPLYVRAKAVLEDADLFDASFFGFNAAEAEITDPQQRLFLECAWEALENAGYDPETYPGLIGTYAGASTSGYLHALIANREILELMGSSQIFMGNDKDYLPTRVSYKLNLRGPAINIQTACSTSLVAVHLACRALLDRQCDMALAGGVSARFPQKEGYLYIPGGIMSPDGHCRAFDSSAEGTIEGQGVGIVVLKRLSDALKDGDHIHALILGSAINNDGSLKIGYSAPSVDGQADVITVAQRAAGVEVETITHIEAHGTGTSLGDPIEAAALDKAFRQSTDQTGFCALGSVKTNIGHLDAAAGIAGLMKTALAMRHKQLPPSLHFQEPNPAIDFKASPFYVNTELREWESENTPRRAGVSSFGIGGTNAHVILEEAPVQQHINSRPDSPVTASIG